MGAVHAISHYATSGGQLDGRFIRKLYGAFYFDRQPVSPGCGDLFVWAPNWSPCLYVYVYSWILSSCLYQ